MKAPIRHTIRFAVAAMMTGWTATVFAADPSPIISADLISRADATRAVEAALAACAARGEPATALVMDVNGSVRAELSDDGAKVIGLSTSAGKAAAVLTFKESTRDLVARLQADAGFAAQYGKDPRFHFSPGALPIYKNGQFVALIAVGGARDIDEDCAREGLKTLSWATTTAGSWASGHANQLARVALPARDSTSLTVSSPAFKDGADIPRQNTQYGANLFPGLAWNKGPKGTRSYVVIMQGDPAMGTTTSIHLTLFNLPASVTKLQAGLVSPPAGSTYGPNVHGLNQPYAGPHPHTEARQRYHLQVFALDAPLQADSHVSFEDLESAMTGHVLASGELVGLAAGAP